MKTLIKTIALILCGIFAILVLLIFAYYLFLFVATDFSSDFLKIDRCLDYGGAWDEVNRSCVRD